MAFELGLNTVIILAGPSQSGKTTWTEHFQHKINKIDKSLRVAHLSSDGLRREILGENLDRYDPRMMEASEAAFDLLFSQLKAHIRFPINNEFVVVDTTGLDSDFRKNVSEVAREHGYRVAIVMFDYPTSDYFTGLDKHSKSIVSKHVEAFKQRVLPTIKRKHFDYSFTVKDKSPKYFKDLDVSLLDYALWKKCHLVLDAARPVAFIGDIHEHIDAVELLLARLPEDTQLISIGDIVDKGNNTPAAIVFAEKLLAEGHHIVRGNHESFVARRLKGEIEAVSNEEQNFSSLKVLQENSELAQRFLKIYEATLPFAVVQTHGKTIYATHAPCHNKSLGKLDERNQKFQRNFYFSNRDPNTMIDELSFIEKEAKYSHPLHVFGHVAHSLKNIEVKNKVWLDTGAVYGGRLSALLVYPGGDTKIISQSSTRVAEGELLSFKKTLQVATEVKEVSKPHVSQDEFDKLLTKYNLSSDEKYWLHQFKESGAKFIAGTMSPARPTKIELEPIETALQYFKSKGVKEVVIEPKYMGSRLQVYLHRDHALDFAVTRSGTRAGHQEELQKVFIYWHEILDKQDFWKDTIILDGELLPWSVIGRDLIEKEFLQYGKSIEHELELLAQDETFKQYAQDMQFYVDEHRAAINVFLQQIALYGSDRDTEYKPFTILAIDGESWVNKNQADIFKSLMPHEPYCVINLESENTHEQAREFFNNMTKSFNEKGLAHEGVVVKPVYFQANTAAYIKVRNEHYLYLIYGYDYIFNYAQMVENKKVNKKLEISIKEFEIGQKMLQAKTQSEFLDLACQMKFEMNQESELDSRL